MMKAIRFNRLHLKMIRHNWTFNPYIMTGSTNLFNTSKLTKRSRQTTHDWRLAIKTNLEDRSQLPVSSLIDQIYPFTPGGESTRTTLMPSPAFTNCVKQFK